MIKVTLPKVAPSRVMEIVRELRSMGWVQGKDFDFAYIAESFDDELLELNPRHTLFTFYTEKYSTLFLLKYAS